MADGFEPVEDDEILYRRVPEHWYNAVTNEFDDQAFAPHATRDVTGLSVSRAKYKSAEQAAAGRAGKRYYVAKLRAGDLREAGIEIEQRPNTPGGIDPAHAELPDLNSAKRKETLTLERLASLSSKLCLGVEGPFQS